MEATEDYTGKSDCARIGSRETFPVDSWSDEPECWWEQGIETCNVGDAVGPPRSNANHVLERCGIFRRIRAGIIIEKPLTITPQTSDDLQPSRREVQGNSEKKPSLLLSYAEKWKLQGCYYLAQCSACTQLQIDLEARALSPTLPALLADIVMSCAPACACLAAVDKRFVAASLSLVWDLRSGILGRLCQRVPRGEVPAGAVAYVRFLCSKIHESGSGPGEKVLDLLARFVDGILADGRASQVESHVASLVLEVLSVAEQYGEPHSWLVVRLRFHALFIAQHFPTVPEVRLTESVIQACEDSLHAFLGRDGEDTIAIIGASGQRILKQIDLLSASLGLREGEIPTLGGAEAERIRGLYGLLYGALLRYPSGKSARLNQLALAECMMRIGWHLKAIIHYEIALARTPSGCLSDKTHRRAHVNIGRAYVSFGGLKAPFLLDANLRLWASLQDEEGCGDEIQAGTLLSIILGSEGLSMATKLTLAETFQRGLGAIAYTGSDYGGLRDIVRGFLACVPAGNQAVAESGMTHAELCEWLEDKPRKDQQSYPSIDKLKGSFKSNPPNIDSAATLIEEICAEHKRRLNTLSFRNVRAAYNFLKQWRKPEKTEAASNIAVSRMMLRLIDTIREKEHATPYQHFQDLFERYWTLRLQPELWKEEGGVEAVRQLVRDAFDIGQAPLADGNFTDFGILDQGILAAFLSNFGALCEVFAEGLFADDLPPDLEDKLRLGIKALTEVTEGGHWIPVVGSLLPQHVHNYHRLARCYEELHEYGQACKCYETIVNAPKEAKMRDRSLFEVHIGLAECYKELGLRLLEEGDDGWKIHLQEAEKHFQAAYVYDTQSPGTKTSMEESKNPLFLGKLGSFYLETGKSHKAAEIFEKVLKFADAASPDAKNVYDTFSFRCAIAYRESGQMDEARKRLLTTLARCPKEPYRTGVTNTLRSLEARMAQPVKPEARTYEECDWSVTDLPEDETWESRIVSLMKSKEYEDVLDLIGNVERAVDENECPWYWRLLRYRAQALVALGHGAEAGDALDQALALAKQRSQRASLLKQRGYIYSQAGQYEQAIAAYKSSYDLNAHPGAGVKAASLLRFLGRCDEALGILDRLLRDPSPCYEHRPHQVRVLHSRTLWSRYANAKATSTENIADVEAAAAELIEVIREQEQEWQQADVQVIDSISRMLTEQHASGTICRYLYVTHLEPLVRAAERGLRSLKTTPRAFDTVALVRMQDDTASASLRRAFSQILAQSLVSSYYADSAGFMRRANDAFSRILAFPPELRIECLGNLLVVQRHMPHVIARYAARARECFLRLMDTPASFRAALSDEVFHEQLNAFLRMRIPDSVRPAAYGRGDAVDLGMLAREICVDAEKGFRVASLRNPNPLDWRPPLVLSCRFQPAEGALENDGQLEESATLFEWITLRETVSEIMKVSRPARAPSQPSHPFSHLAGVSTNCEVTLSVTGAGLSFEFLFTHDRPLEREITDREVLEKEIAARWPEKAHGTKLCLATLVSCDSDTRIRLTMKLSPPRLVTGQFRRYLPRFTSLFSQLAHMEGDHFERERAGELFQAEGEGIVPAVAEEWVGYSQSLMDYQFAVEARRLFLLSTAAGAYHPRMYVHELKSNIQLLVAKDRAHTDISDTEIRDLQEKIFRLQASIAGNIFQGDHWMNPGGELTDLGGLLSEMCREFQATYSHVKYAVICPHLCDTPVAKDVLRPVLRNLLLNSTAAVLASEAAYEVTIRVLPPETYEGLLLTVQNSYREDVDLKGSTGIGKQEVERFINYVIGGKVEFTKDPRRGIHISRLFIPGRIVQSEGEPL